MLFEIWPKVKDGPKQPHMRKNKVRFKEVYQIKIQASLPGIKCRHVIYISSLCLLLHKLIYCATTKILIIFDKNEIKIFYICFYYWIIQLKNKILIYF